MMNLIICEGKTDAIFLSYYLGKKYDWKFNSNETKNIKFSMDNDQTFSVYRNGNRKLGIWSVDGCSKFEKSIEHLNEYMRMSGDEIKKIIYMIDRDLCNNDDELLKKFRRVPHEDIDIEWKEFKYLDGFEREVSFEARVLIIPSEDKGALETVFLNTLKNENLENKILIDQTCEFVDSFEGFNLQRYLKRNREKLKAKFLTVISLMEPIRSFDTVDMLIKSFDWHNHNEINDIFEIFGEI